MNLIAHRPFSSWRDTWANISWWIVFAPSLIWLGVSAVVTVFMIGIWLMMD